jgi:carbonic anhydrase
LYDPKIDDLERGGCCSRIKYQQFPAERGLASILIALARNKKVGPPTIKFNRGTQCRTNCSKSPLNSVSRPKKEIVKTKQAPVFNANFCIDLYVPDEARWRICSGSQDKISKLHMKILFNLVDKKLKGKASAIANILSNSRAGREPPIPSWTWDNQDKWKGTCTSTLMQSPIDIISNRSIKASGINFTISHHLLSVHTLIKRNEKEVIVAFMNFGGLFQISIDNSYLLFTPVYLSFRFPGEHLVDSGRKLGEILIHFAELSTQRKTSTTNGFVLSIPIQPTTDALEIEAFEQLNIDFWKYEIEKHGTYAPKRFLKKNLLTFDLGSIMKKVTNLRSNYYFYFGSHTTPPCKEQTYHMVVEKPLKISGCQFKLLRDNSLFSTQAKAIHARLQKDATDRPVYKLSYSQVLYIRSIAGIVPQGFNKYLLLHGYLYKRRAQNRKRGKGKKNPWNRLFGGKGAGSDGDEWLDELNCDVPKN